MKTNRRNKGFTLVELLVVISIIGLLATLAIVSLNNARTRSRDARRVSDLRTIQTALELYFDEYDSVYPIAEEFTNSWNEIGSDSLEARLSSFLQGSLPLDPLNNDQGYYYVFISNQTGEGFVLRASIESTGSSSFLDGDIDNNEDCGSGTNNCVDGTALVDNSYFVTSRNLGPLRNANGLDCNEDGVAPDYYCIGFNDITPSS